MAECPISYYLRTDYILSMSETKLYYILDHTCVAQLSEIIDSMHG